uniref:2Fe-2S ferredoxin-type domain-containing protein n=1 Tax=Eptatretus burgeri TaxID=7764 RepID=A0A8C4R9T7_EPTBU
MISLGQATFQSWPPKPEAGCASSIVKHPSLAHLIYPPTRLSSFSSGLVPLPHILLNLTPWKRMPSISLKSRELKMRWVNICLLNRDGKPLWMSGRVGETLLNVVMNANGPVEGYGACEGTLACTTCHVYLPTEAYERMCQPTEDELDMLDLAVGLAETSRLGCQVVLKPWMDGMRVQVPKHTADLRGLADDGKMEG